MENQTKRVPLTFLNTLTNLNYWKHTDIVFPLVLTVSGLAILMKMKSKMRKKKSRINYKGKNGKRSKQIASLGYWKKWLTTIQRLLCGKATPVNTRDEDQCTPLHRAACSGHLDRGPELTAQGAGVHAVTVDGWTPLHSAYKRRDHRGFFLTSAWCGYQCPKASWLPCTLLLGNETVKTPLNSSSWTIIWKPDLKDNLRETALDISSRTYIDHYWLEILEGCTNSSPPS